MRTPEHVWLVVDEEEKVVGAQMPNGEPSVYAVPIGQSLKDALDQMARDKWQALSEHEPVSSSSYKIKLVRENPPQ